MDKAAGKAELVPKVGDTVEIVFHGYFEGEPLAGRKHFEVGTTHEVTDIGVGYYELDDNTFVLPEEIKVIDNE